MTSCLKYASREKDVSVIHFPKVKRSQTLAIVPCSLQVVTFLRLPFFYVFKYFLMLLLHLEIIICVNYYILVERLFPLFFLLFLGSEAAICVATSCFCCCKVRGGVSEILFEKTVIDYTSSDVFFVNITVCKNIISSVKVLCFSFCFVL